MHWLKTCLFNDSGRFLSILTYLGPLHEEQRPSTTSRHLTRSWAAFITPFQQVSCCAISVSVLRLQLLRGRPLFLSPCGFHLRAWRVVLFGGFLKVWPIQDNFLLRICLETGSCLALSHSTLFLSLSDHLIPNILLRHVMSAAASVPFLLFSTFHSHRIKLTLELKILILVSVLTSFDVHTFFSIMKAPLAFPILDVTSSSVPPCLVMVLPR